MSPRIALALGKETAEIFMRAINDDVETEITLCHRSETSEESGRPSVPLYELRISSILLERPLGRRLKENLELVNPVICRAGFTFMSR